MAQDGKRLPEGTDKVIAGASGSSGAATGDVGGGSEETILAERPAGGAKGQGKVFDTLRTSRDKLSGQAAGKARDFVGQGIERSSDALTNVGRLVSDTASGLDERLGSEYGDYARRAGEAIEDAARKLAAKDADELIDDTREFVRKSPGVALAGAAIVGFALARLIKSGLDSGRGERGGSEEGR